MQDHFSQTDIVLDCAVEFVKLEYLLAFKVDVEWKI